MNAPNPLTNKAFLLYRAYIVQRFFELNRTQRYEVYYPSMGSKWTHSALRGLNYRDGVNSHKGKIWNKKLLLI